jgi:hypothetical protein
MSTLRNRGPPAGPCGAAELHKLSKQQANYISNECQGSAQRKCQGSARSLTGGRALRLAGCEASHSFSAALTRVCQPGPLALRAPTTSGSSRIATCSFAGRLFGPRVRRSTARVEATPPPDVTVPLLQTTFTDSSDGSVVAAFRAAAISAALKGLEVVVGFLTVGIAA